MIPRNKCLRGHHLGSSSYPGTLLNAKYLYHLCTCSNIYTPKICAWFSNILLDNRLGYHMFFLAINSTTYPKDCGKFGLVVSMGLIFGLDVVGGQHRMMPGYYFICRLTMCGSYISNHTINITLYRRVTTEEAIDLSQGRCCHSDLNTWQNYTNNNAVPLMNILTRSQPTLHQLSQKGRHDVLQALPIKSNQVTNSSKLCSPS